MKANRLFTMLIVATLIAVIVLTVQEVMATSAVVSEVNSITHSFANEEGMAIYNESERGSGQVASVASNEEGLAIYHESERKSGQIMSVASNQEGLTIYHDSERNSGQFAATVSKDEGMSLYHASERQATIVNSVRMFNGQPFNAYQRSEWLGADR